MANTQETFTWSVTFYDDDKQPLGRIRLEAPSDLDAASEVHKLLTASDFTVEPVG